MLGDGDHPDASSPEHGLEGDGVLALSYRWSSYESPSRLCTMLWSPLLHIEVNDFASSVSLGPVGGRMNNGYSSQPVAFD